jgi:DNA-binding NarL/FixJ family response regulator
MATDCGPIFVVDDDAHSREFLRALLNGGGYADVLELETGEEALVQADDKHPSLVLLDIVLPGISGYEVCHQLRDRFGDKLPIIFVSGTRIEPHDRVAGLLIGADDYLVKPFFPGELVARVRRLLVRNGAENGNGANGDGPLARLSDREREVLRLLAEGQAQESIATELFISPKTVATHIQRILTKLDVHSRAEAVGVAYREGLVDPDVAAHAAI